MKAIKAHQLVAMAFIGPRFAGYEINHKDGNKANNSVANLEWVTPAENKRHAQKNGLVPRHVGIHNGRAKLTDAEVSEILAQRGHVTQRCLAMQYGVSIKTIQAIHQRVRWSHVASGEGKSMSNTSREFTEWEPEPDPDDTEGEWVDGLGWREQER